MNDGDWLPTPAALCGAVEREARTHGESPPPPAAALLEHAAWLVAQQAGIPLWCGSAVAAALLRPDNPARGEDALEAGRRQARALMGLQPMERDAVLDSGGAPAPMPRWTSPAPRARVRYDLAEVVAVATYGVSARGTGTGGAVAVARAHSVVAALQAAVERGGQRLAGEGLDHRVVRALFASAGLSAPAFLRLAAGEAFAAWVSLPHDGLEWPILDTDTRMCTQVFAVVGDIADLAAMLPACALIIGLTTVTGCTTIADLAALLPACAWRTTGAFLEQKGRQVLNASMLRAQAAADARLRERVLRDSPGPPGPP